MKLLIVDDGHYIVEYLKHLLDWKLFGIHHIQTSTNSIEARELLDQNQIDILITDIRMPEVSGIDLLEHIHQHKLKTKVIFLSGYSQFDYAQKAIRLGILDYLLKPVDKEDMERAMEKAVKIIKAQPAAAAIDWESFDGLGFLLSILCEAPVEAAANVPNYEQYADLFGEDRFCFFKIPMHSANEEAAIRDYNNGLDCFVWAAESMLAGIVRHTDAETVAARINHIELSDSFQFSRKNRVRHHFYHFFYNEQVSANDYAWRKDCGAFLLTADTETLRKAVYKKYNQLEHNKDQLLFVMELIYTLHKASTSLTQADITNWMFNGLHTPEQTLQSMLACISQNEKTKKLSNERTIHMIKEYIESHLGDSLSLEELGDHVHLHPVYLSKLYKQETGENLSAYISARRLEKASRLLVESNLHVVDISQMVGYKKTQYFIKLFKDEYGITPQQYRKQQLQP